MKKELTVFKNSRFNIIFSNWLFALISGLPLILGTYRGYTNNPSNSTKTDIISLVNSAESFKPAVDGNFLSDSFHIFIHNFLLDLIYGIISLLTLGIAGIITIFSNGLIFGQVFNANHSLLTTIFVLTELICMWIIVFIGMKTGWELVIYKKNHIKNVKNYILGVAIALLIAAVIETTLVRGGLN